LYRPQGIFTEKPTKTISKEGFTDKQKG